jgi:hypothetical protein
MSDSMNSSVTKTLHNEAADRCVKIVKRSDGTYGFTEFRRDPEDAGHWTQVGDHPQAIPTEGEAVAAARAGVRWLRDMPTPATAIALNPTGAQAKPSRALLSLHNDEVDRCVDIVANADGTFGFKEFRRDPEDRGGWTLVSYNPRAVFTTQQQAITAAKASVAWLRDHPA